MMRVTVAFFIAPLVVPLSLLPWLSSGRMAAGWIATAMVIAALLSYTGTLFLGMPPYCLLKARGLTAAWIAATLGFVSGALMWLVFLVLFPLPPLGQGLAGVRLTFTNLHSLSGALWPAGVLGMIVGILFWLIARPHRRLCLRPAVGSRDRDPT